MTGKQFKAIRKKLGLTAAAWARALGFQGMETSSMTRSIYRYESGERGIPTRTERLAIMYKKHGIPDEWL